MDSKSYQGDGNQIRVRVIMIVMVIVMVIVPYLEISKIFIIDHQLPTWMLAPHAIRAELRLPVVL